MGKTEQRFVVKFLCIHELGSGDDFPIATIKRLDRALSRWGSFIRRILDMSGWRKAFYAMSKRFPLTRGQFLIFYGASLNFESFPVECDRLAGCAKERRVLLHRLQRWHERAFQGTITGDE
jgi:hypothetical protein